MGFFIIFNSNWGKDEPRTLRYAITQNCSMGADVRQAIAEGYITEMDAACKADGRNFLVLYDPIIEIDLGGTVEREVIFDQNGLQCEGDSSLFEGSAGSHVDVISSNGQLMYMSQSRPSIVRLDEHWALRFEMDPSVETEECADYCFRYVYVSGSKLVERYISEW